MADRIDAYSHATTEALIDRYATLSPSLEVPEHPPLLFLKNAEQRIERLEACGVDKQVITIAEQRAWLEPSPEDAIDATRFANDEIRRYADEYPDWFVPVGTIPYLTGPYLDELERCIDDLDMPGVQIFSNVDGKFLDDEEFYRFYEIADEADVPIWIHPQDADWDGIDHEDYWLYTMIGWPYETAITLARLVFNGVLDEFENLRVVSHHLGGVLPYIEERMDSWATLRLHSEPGERTGAESMHALSEPFESYFDRIYGDTAVSSQRRDHTLRCGYEFFGEDNVLFAADVPYGPDEGFEWMENVVPTIEDMDIPDASKRKIFSENVESLL